jgi:hypothetical protein
MAADGEKQMAVDTAIRIAPCRQTKAQDHAGAQHTLPRPAQKHASGVRSLLPAQAVTSRH